MSKFDLDAFLESEAPPPIPTDWRGYGVLDQWYAAYQGGPKSDNVGRADLVTFARRVFLMEHYLVPIMIGGDPEPHGDRDEAWGKWMAAMRAETPPHVVDSGDLAAEDPETVARLVEFVSRAEARRIFQAVDSVTSFS